ncbi:hypothetical protein GQ457_13G029460 [Hibiscus cannabinus]
MMLERSLIGGIHLRSKLKSCLGRLMRGSSVRQMLRKLGVVGKFELYDETYDGEQAALRFTSHLGIIYEAEKKFPSNNALQPFGENFRTAEGFYDMMLTKVIFDRSVLLQLEPSLALPNGLSLKLFDSSDNARSQANVVYCKSENRVADVLTKAVSRPRLEFLRTKLGVSKKNLNEKCWTSDTFLRCCSTTIVLHAPRERDIESVKQALDTFNTAVVCPVYYVMFTTFTIIASMIMFKLQNHLYYASKFTFSSKFEVWDPNTDCCSWEGVSCDSLGHVIGLDLSYKNLSGSFHSIFDLHHLHRLNLAGNNFNTTLLSYGFDKIPHLTHLNLSKSCFHGQIPMEISNLTRLVSLDLSRQEYCYWRNDYYYYYYYDDYPTLKLEKPNLKTLIKNLKFLTELYLDDVDISSESSKWCETTSFALPNLQVLSLSWCGLEGPLCPSLSALPFLSKLVLDYNPISYLPPNFLEISSRLVSLSLVECNLSGRFPTEILLLPKIQSIDISYNERLEGQLPEFPSNNALRSLSLYATNISGKLPESIGNLKFLTDLTLSRCNFVGSIPSSIANLSHLVNLDLSANHFSGSIPSSLFTLPSLKVLSLGENQLVGKIDEFPNASSSMIEKKNKATPSEFMFQNHEISTAAARAISCSSKWIKSRVLFLTNLKSVLIFRYVPRYGQNHLIVYIGICSLMGSLTALDTFNTAVVCPVYYVMFTTFTIIASMIMFKAQGSEEACYQLGESEQIGGTFKDQPAVVSENLEKQPGEMEKTRGIECDQIVCTSSKGLNWAEAVKKNLNETNDRPSLIQIAKDESQVIEAENLLYAKAVEDVSNMGCKLTGPNNESWAKEIENKMNTGWDPNTKLSDKSSGTHSEEERDNYFFSELEARKILSKSKKGKRYGSLLELQDKAISGTERKKRDRAWRRLRLNKKDLEVSELSGRSLSESDLEVRWALATKEARKVLALGKNIGMQIVGDEQEVINELANLEGDFGGTK